MTKQYSQGNDPKNQDFFNGSDQRCIHKESGLHAPDRQKTWHDMFERVRCVDSFSCLFFSVVSYQRGLFFLTIHQNVRAVFRYVTIRV